MAACKAIASILGSRSSLFINNSKLGFIKTIIPNESRRQFVTLTSGFGSSSTFSKNKCQYKYIKEVKNDRQIHVSSCLDASKKKKNITNIKTSKNIKKKAYGIEQTDEMFKCNIDNNNYSYYYEKKNYNLQKELKKWPLIGVCLVLECLAGTILIIPSIFLMAISVCFQLVLLGISLIPLALLVLLCLYVFNLFINCLCKKN